MNMIGAMSKVFKELEEPDKKLVYFVLMQYFSSFWGSLLNGNYAHIFKLTARNLSVVGYLQV